MADAVDYSDAQGQFRTGDEGIAALISGQLPNGTPVYMPTQLFGEDENGDILALWAERVTKAMSVITSDHALIHAGKAYTLSGFITVANAQTAAVALTCPASSYVHFKPASVGASGLAKLTLYEDATFTGGTAATPRNRNRRYPDASILTCKTLANATITGNKIEIAHGFVSGGGQGANKIGGSAQSAEEHVLDESLTYVLGIENISGSSITAMYDIFWYEESGV